MPRLVIVDTNVVVAALLTSQKSSPTARLLDSMLDGRLQFLLSPALLAEYQAVLTRPKIQIAHGLSVDQIDTLLTDITANAIWREPTGLNHNAPHHEAPDPNDTHLWALLDCEKNATLITGDMLLLKNAPEGRQLVKPSDYNWD
jgi:putative PIN family toxin of toxin-antitoxin system